MRLFAWFNIQAKRCVLCTVDIADKTTESDYQPVKRQVEQELTDLNGMIVHSLQTAGSGF